MQVTELDSKGLHKEYKVVVEAEHINSEIEKELHKAGESVKIPGFRPGNIPLKVLKQRYGKAVQSDVLKNVINQCTTETITERKLRPAQTPSVSIDDYEEGGALTFNISFDVFPEIPEMAFDKITINRKVFEMPESEIDNALARIAENSPKMVSAKDGVKAELGNVVKIDFAGKRDGVAFEGGTAKDFNLELGSGQFIAGFEEQLVGKTAGEDVLVEVTFPEDYQSKELAGQPVTFDVKIKAILTKEKADIDDAFAKERGLDDVKALREAVKKQLCSEYDQVVRNDQKKQLFDILENDYKFELPQTMVDMEYKTIWDRLKEAQKEGDETLITKSDEELKEEYTKVAERRVKLGILLAEVGHRSKIEITQEELMRAVLQHAGMFPGQEEQVVKYYREHPERMDELRGPILEEKAVDYILEQVTFNDSTVTLDELSALDKEEAQAETDGASKPKKKAASKKKAAAKKTADAAPKKKAAGGKE